jgi:glucosamine-6-phosphate deaminase
MHQNLFGHIDILPENCHLPDGLAIDLKAECERYDRAIELAGGIDLQILGIGSDGHIAFNEPGSSLGSRTRPKALTPRTRQDNARFFGSLDLVPKLAISMGIANILEASQIVLMAIGQSKSEAVQAMVEGPITALVPASALQFHPSVTVLVDPPAASRLSRLEYYQYAEGIQSDLEERLPAIER